MSDARTLPIDVPQEYRPAGCLPVVHVWVPGEPKGQPRPRAFARNGKARVYDPGTAEHWKSCVAAAMRDRLTFTFMGPVYLCLNFVMPRPKSHYRTGKHSGELRDTAPFWHTGKPDYDNLAKAVTDALTTLRAWVDDAQVAEARVTKRYAGPDERPGCWVRIEELEDAWNRD